jgi:reticulon-4-interacting protein 1, mitochondrial
LEEASGISLSALTAYQGLLSIPRIPLFKGQSVFINGGSGGVGLFAIQIARYIVGETGKVVTSCSSRNIELVKKYGADEAIDYTIVNLSLHLSQTYSDSRFDLILDCVGSFEMFRACPAFLKPQGDFVIIGMDVPHTSMGLIATLIKIATVMFLPTFLGGVPRRLRLFVMDVSKEHVECVGSLAERKEIRPVVDSIWQFDDGVKEAYSKIMSNHARGKVVIQVVR